MALTSMPKGRTSRASVSTNRTTAAFDTAYALMPGERIGGAAARELNDFPVTVLFEMGEQRPAHQHRPEQIDFDGADPVVPGDRLDRSHRPVNARVVDEDVHSAEGVTRFRGDARHIIGLRHIR